MKPRSAILTATLALGLGACASPGTPPPQADSQLMLELEEPVVVPAGEGGVHLGRGQLDRFEPWCRLTVHELPATDLTVRPDEFLVLEMRRHVWMVDAGGRPLQLALRGLWYGSLFDQDRPSHVTYATRIRLASDRQPQVRGLECGHWQEPPWGRHLNLAEIAGAVAPQAQLRPLAGKHGG